MTAPSEPVASGAKQRLFETFDAMQAALDNNSSEARRRAQFRNVMESLVRFAREAALRELADALEHELEEAA